MTAVLPSDIDRLEAHETPSEYSAKCMRAFVEKTRGQIGAVLAAIEEDLGLSITLESDASLAPGSARVGGGAAGSGASRSRTRTTRSRSAAKPAGA
jgi:hypothetical protein